MTKKGVQLLNDMKNNKVNLLFLIIGAAILTVLLYDFGIDNLWENIQMTGWWLFPVTGIWLIIYILNAQAWRVIIGNSTKVRFFKLLSLKITGFSINYLTPVVGLAGEPWKILNIKHFIGVEKASSSVILYNMMHILSHLYFWATAIILIFLSARLPVAAIVMLALILAILIGIIALFYAWYSKGVVFSLLRLLRPIPGLRKIVTKIESNSETLQNIEQQIVGLYTKRRKSFYYSLAIEYFARIIGALEFYFIMKAISFDITILEAIYISAASSMLANIFFFIPLQLGTREGSLYLVYESLKLTPALGVFVSLVTRIREFFWILIGLLLLKIDTSTNNPGK